MEFLIKTFKFFYYTFGTIIVICASIVVLPEISEKYNISRSLEARFDERFNAYTEKAERTFGHYNKRIVKHYDHIENTLEMRKNKVEAIKLELAGLFNQADHKLKVFDKRISNLIHEKEKELIVLSIQTDEKLKVINTKLTEIEERINAIDSFIIKVEDLLEDEFNETVDSASEKFNQNIKVEKARLNVELNNFEINIKEILTAKVIEYDGFKNRFSKNSEEIKKEITNTINFELTNSVLPAYKNFKERYNEELTLLEDRLLLPEIATLQLSQKKIDLFIPEYIVEDLSNDLDSLFSDLWKIGDEALSWVPFFFIGDGYDLAKMIYDPRYEYIKNKVEPVVYNLTENIKFRMKSLTNNLENKDLTDICKDNFDGDYAFKMFLKG
jgi:hypothetical protein